MTHPTPEQVDGAIERLRGIDFIIAGEDFADDLALLLSVVERQREALSHLNYLGEDIDLDYAVDSLAAWDAQEKLESSEDMKRWASDRKRAELNRHVALLLKACRTLIVIRNAARAALGESNDA